MNRGPETAPAEDIPLAVTTWPREDQMDPKTESPTVGNTPSIRSSHSRHNADSNHERRTDLHAHFDSLPGEPEVASDVPVIDIEHVPVDDDPREWSDKKKVR